MVSIVNQDHRIRRYNRPGWRGKIQGLGFPGRRRNGTVCLICIGHRVLGASTGAISENGGNDDYNAC